MFRPFVIVATIVALCVLSGGAWADPTPLTGAEPNTVVLYNLNEFPGDGNVVAAGTPVFDSSGHGYNGKTYVACRNYHNTDLGTGFGNDLRQDSKVYIPGNILSASLFQGSFTMEMWVRSGSIINSSGLTNGPSRFFTSRDNGLGWIFEIYKNASNQNVLRVHNGGSWVDNVLVGFTLPTTTWSHWAASFTNTNPGSNDSRYSVSLYITPSTSTDPRLVGTFTLDPASTATQLAAIALTFNGDQPGGGFGNLQDGDVIDGLRLSDIARTSFETLQSQIIPTDQPPTAVTDLAASNPAFTSLALAWHAPWDDNYPGNKAVSYDLRYSTSPITTTTWASATPATGLPAPATAGTAQAFTVTGLSPATTYYFAIKSADLAGNISAFSNVASGATLIPDTTPPAAVSDLTVTNVKSTQLLLHWSATGDDGMTGSAVAYDVRYSTSPITAANFAAATVVSQSLTPKAPGQPETLPVTGLTPSATYYFAVKVSDEVPNWSAPSNIVQVTMNPPDIIPPAPVTDLAAAGSDALGANLTWTATGNDGNVGQAASYDVRYSTGPITAANWAAATVVPNMLVPQAVGGVEHFTVLGLQPSTQYYFALKVIDAEGNISGLSNVVAHTTGPLGDMPLVTTVTIIEKAGATTANYPMTLSMGFKKGDVTDSVTVRAAGLILPTQTDVKVRWDDGSVRHALVSFLIPTLHANETLALEFLAGRSNYNTTWMTPEQLLAGDFEALMTLTVGGSHYTASGRQMLQGIATPEYWLKGGICTEFIIRDWNTRVAGQLNVSYRVRVYPGAAAIRVSTVVENTWIDARGNLTYDVSLQLGRSNPQLVLSKTNLTHSQSARWHKVYWQGATPPAVDVHYNVPYLIAGGFLPQYDTSIVVPAGTLTSYYNTWNGYAHDIMDGGTITKYFPTTGGRDEIAPYPMWSTYYLFTMDSRMREITLTHGDLSGSIPIHFRESDAARSAYRRPVTIDDRPTVWLSDSGWTYTNPADRLPDPVGPTTTPWTIDMSHQGSFAYVPYLATGDLYYLEEMQFWACYDLGAESPGYRSNGWFIESTRGMAWAFRNLVDAAAMTPDGDPNKVYLSAKVGVNINHWVNDYIINGTLAGKYPSARYIKPQGATGGPGTGFAADVTWQSPPWQDDYMMTSLIHARDMGYPVYDVINWLGNGLIDRFSFLPGWNPYNGAPYYMPVKHSVAGQDVEYATWADLNNGFEIPSAAISFPSNDYPDSYNYHARGALALISHLAGALDRFNWIDSQLLNKNQLPTDPRWAFLPGPRVSDVNRDSSIDVVDLLYFVDAFGSVIGDANYNAACDFNGDFGVDVVDLLILVENFGT